MQLMASTIASNPILTNNQRRKKKKKTSINEAHNTNNPIKWKSEQQQQSYSSKLLKALSKFHINEAGSAGSLPRRGRAVREAADRALAVAAKGRTRWSRAILMNRIKFSKLKKVKRQIGSAVDGASRAKKPKVSVLALKGKSLPAVQRKVKVLGRLVPGCKKEDFPVILEEATDYIAALEMQVKAMSALADLFSGGASSSSFSSSSSSASSVPVPMPPS